MKPSTFLVGAAALAAIAGCNSQPGDAAGNAPVNIEPVAPPAGRDWTQVVSRTSQGGFLMGNPQASVKLIEFGSMTCPHCRDFDEEGLKSLMDKYVKTGQVSFEFRNYVRDAFDLTASLVARCNGENGFFPLTTAMFADQDNWVGKIQATPEAQLQQLQGLPPTQQFVEMAKIAGFQQWAAMRGVPEAKSAQCLRNEAEINQLVQMTSDATSQFPDFVGTPSFVINGKLLEKTTSWKLLEPQLRNALGERG